VPIHPKTRIGAVHLTVSDLDQSVDFYKAHLGLSELSRDSGTAALGAGDQALLSLKESRNAPRPRRTTGLYHFAILVPSRLHLARSLRHFADMGTRMQGFSDHSVSEALYLADPDGIGIEVYRDRPRDEWKWAGGRLAMTLDPLDVEGLLRDADADHRASGHRWDGLAPGTTMGHVHLRVSFLEDTERFYREVLGFDLTQRYGDSALFLSAGGYHHHLAANVWAGVGAPRPPEGAIGLDYFEILLPDGSALAEVSRRVRSAGIDATIDDSRIETRDPSGNAIVLAPVA
jgi:catechol 2,3-dioxygenase